MQFSVGATERMRIDSSGRVLIGLNSSSANTSIDDLQVGNPNAATQHGITIGSNDEAAIAFANNGDARAGSITYTMSSDAMIFKTDGQNERLRISSSGLIGINNTAANTGALIDIQGNAAYNNHIRLRSYQGGAVVEHWNGRGISDNS